MSKIIKAVIILIVLAAIALASYEFVVKPGAVGVSLGGLTTSTGASNIVTADQDVGGEFLQMLLNLKAIKLNTSIFDNTSYKSLKDYTVVLEEPKNVGRPNPFAPVGQDVVVPPKQIPGTTR